MVDIDDVKKAMGSHCRKALCVLLTSRIAFGVNH